MAASDLIITIAIVALLGAAVAYLVGRVADRDKARREAANPPPPPGPAPAFPGLPATPAAGAGGECPTCRTPYRPDLAFCWACGRDKVAAARP